MNNCQLLDIEFEYNGQNQIITPVLIQDEQENILVDCGYPNFLPYLEKAVQQKGISFESITKLIVTHHDMDHIGSLAEIKRAYPHITIIAYELEKPYIEGAKTSLRIEQAKSTLGELQDEAKNQAEQFIRFLASIEPAPVDQTVVNDECLPWCGGIQIVHTPGHMPGHISLYLPSSKTLIAGDAVVLEHGKLNIANPQFTMDMEAAVSSVRRLLDFGIERIICYHGGLFHGNVKQALQDLVREYTP
ncbi:MBL fold metallo-hydrolase [Paenibacillus donghaensis]|uniref:MBL fold metallo-hydrolase n=1 Tax=Paenibacillus donghaensis TaxID=414771 RepID=UPI0018838D6B|nr:MBL fold metallo-hydrolase [Paenibacillus donghaensis]MBE9912419.1 MBL fold metallo-hydrolase [Paenibacillus donghaensis]